MAQAQMDMKQSALEARIAGMSLPESGAWLAEARKDASARLAAMGLPARRDEYWRFTRPDGFNAPAPETAVVFDHGGEVPVFDAQDRIKLVFVDGIFRADLSDPLEGENLTIERLADAGKHDIHWAKELYGKLEARGQSPVERPFAAMNTAYATDGVLIHVTGKAAKPVNIIYRRESDSSDAILHHVVKLDAGAELTLLENGPAATRFNKLLEADVADGAKLNHIRTQGRDHERQAATHMFARLGAESVFKTFTLTVNGRLTRNETVVEMLGDDASAHIAGACLGDGDFHHDDTVFITHDAVNCESRQVFKKVLRNEAKGVFQGKILVKPGAQKTDGYQKSQALLLDDASQFLAKPELEIYADDVACSHGSTAGAIDEDTLFYLRSRGVPLAAAKDLVVLAFVADALAEIEDEQIAEDLTGRLAAWLDRRKID